ncbi:hypothetical protein EAH75_07670 [Rhodanobacter glycinis]|uniref:Uncharacterized protein n=2 Tax=Rhodanobacter glycinis TaxID=582702 RepID=A0A502CCN8_9GAMM|nr:hypothetical protein EAH88_05460 [Rhodanobacter glycinis]TPG51251.1 hypothetical protein EAH75_07670 [Rhodanobacter glycinis]
MFAGLAGCVPWPHHYLTAPRIAGTIVKAGQPVAGVRIQLADVMDESGETASTAKKLEVVTDAQGHFTVGPIRRFAWSAHVPVLTVTLNTVPWGLRLSTDGQSFRAGWLSDPTLFGEVLNVPVVATCDLNAASKSSVIAGYKSLVGNGPCTLTAESKK